jgi:hypothetical protein
VQKASSPGRGGHGGEDSAHSSSARQKSDGVVWNLENSSNTTSSHSAEEYFIESATLLAGRDEDLLINLFDHSVKNHT